jgi:hypothetical protein
VAHLLQQLMVWPQSMQLIFFIKPLQGSFSSRRAELMRHKGRTTSSKSVSCVFFFPFVTGPSSSIVPLQKFSLFRAAEPAEWFIMHGQYCFE